MREKLIQILLAAAGAALVLLLATFMLLGGDYPNARAEASPNAVMFPLIAELQGHSPPGGGVFTGVMETNKALIDLIRRIAEEKNATSTQIALAWQPAQKPLTVPLAGTTKLPDTPDHS